MSDRPQITQDLAEAVYNATNELMNAHQDLTIRIDGLDRRVRELRGNDRRGTKDTENPVFAEIDHLQKRMAALEESVGPILKDRYPGMQEEYDEEEEAEEPVTITELFNLMVELANKVNRG